MSVCIPTYMMASGLIAGGMDWFQAIFTILLGNLIVLVPMLLNAHAGTRYGIPFPVFVRASFGVRGANIPAVLARACRLRLVRHSNLDRRPSHLLHAAHCAGPPRQMIPGSFWICFFFFWAHQHVRHLAGHRNHKISRRHRRALHADVGLFFCSGLHARLAASAPSCTPEQISFHLRISPLLHSSLTGMVGFWSTVALNIPDFTRYAKSQRAQMIGQALGLPPAMTLYAFIGVAVTSASVVLFGEPSGIPSAARPFQSTAHRAYRLIALLSPR